MAARVDPVIELQPECHGQAGIEDTTIDYYDIMVIGKTGMGKSTTADKLLVANPNGLDYRGGEYSEPVAKEGRMNVEDLSIWLLSDTPDELNRVKTRLKNIAFIRGLDDAHEEINAFHSEHQFNSGMTPGIELISNDSTKIRVLDIPGFFGEGDAGMSLASAKDKASCSVNVALGRMRNILRIQASMHMKFRKILYFLPVHGALKRSDSYLETELATLAKYFGRSIFDCMIVVTTMSAEAYDGGSQIVFSDKAVATTKTNFASALTRVFPDETNLPDPPILFISMAHTCNTVLANVTNTHVACDHVTLQLEARICVRCGSEVDVIKLAEKEKEKVKGVGVHETEFRTIPYEDSTCHPLFIPKHTKVVRFFRGIVHVASFKKLFKSYLDEVCVECQQKPGSRGCARVKTKYELKGEYLVVDHTNNTKEPIKVEGIFDQNSLPSEIQPSNAMPSPAAEVHAETQNVDDPSTESNLQE